MIHLVADSGTKLHKVDCRYRTPAYPELQFGSRVNALRWAAKRKRALCAWCKPLGGDDNAAGTEQ